VSELLYNIINNILIWLKLVRQADYSHLYEKLQKEYELNYNLMNDRRELKLGTLRLKEELDYIKEYAKYIEDTNNLCKELDIEARKHLEYFPLPDANISMNTFLEQQTIRIAVQFNQTKCYDIPKNDFVDKAKQPYLFKAVANELSQTYADELSKKIIQTLEAYNE